MDHTQLLAGWYCLHHWNFCQLFFFPKCKTHIKKTAALFLQCAKWNLGRIHCEFEPNDSTCEKLRKKKAILTAQNMFP